MAVFEYDGRLLIIDCGVLFPEENQPGVDLILPDFDADPGPARRRRGASSSPTATRTTSAPCPTCCASAPTSRWSARSSPWRCSRPSCGSTGIDAVRRIEVARGRPDQRSGRSTCEFVAVNHSIPDALAVAIRTGAGMVLHTGDFKMDQLPLDGRITDLRAFARLGEEGVDLFLVDSTNAEVPGFTTSERDIAPGARPGVPHAAEQRIIVACFASHVHRVQQVMDAAVAHGRKVAYVGRSMVRNMGVARDLGYLDVPAGHAGRHARARRACRRSEVVLISHRLAGRAAVGAGPDRAPQPRPRPHRARATPSSSRRRLIPGNENAVYRVINGLTRLGANVVHKGNALVHVSGHASAGELLYCYNIVRPRNVMPVHGEIRHLLANAALASDTGVAAGPRGRRRGRRRRRPGRRRGRGHRQGRLRLRLRRRLVGRRHHRDRR